MQGLGNTMNQCDNSSYLSKAQESIMQQTTVLL